MLKTYLTRSVLFAALLLASSMTLAEEMLSYTVLSQDKDVVVDLKTDAKNVWIKLASAYTSDPIIVRISDKSRDYYRPWSTGDLNLTSVGYRGNNVWSDRVQTSAPFIEYWHNEKLVLHLEKK